ncbi:MAG TPA: thioredoxin [Fimbriimonas sp.]|nr:thioredoxin [Fimbriimonas sp.]
MENNGQSSLVFDLHVASFKDEVVNNPLPILIDFWAPWCGPCRAMKPILDDVAKKLEGQVRVAKVNVDEEPQIASAFNIRSIPTCYLLKGEKVLGSFVGVIPAPELVSKVLAKLN